MENNVSNELTLSLMQDICDKKFKTSIGNRTFHDFDKIKKDERFEISKSTINYYYYELGYGIKYIDKTLNLKRISILRFCMINFFDIILRDNKIVTDNLRMLRKNKAVTEAKNKTGWCSVDIQSNIKIRSCSRGIQGYYYNKYLNKNVWLRSSWEYIYAKWLDTNNIKWDIEVKTYKLKQNKTYRPDFFIYNETNELCKIVEIKGYWKDKVWKYDELKTMLDIDIILITDIKPYTTNLKSDCKFWKEKNKK